MCIVHSILRDATSLYTERYLTYAKGPKPTFSYPNPYTAILRELEGQGFLYHLFGEAFGKRGVGFYGWFRPPTYAMR